LTPAIGKETVLRGRDHSVLSSSYVEQEPLPAPGEQLVEQLVAEPVLRPIGRRKPRIEAHLAIACLVSDVTMLAAALLLELVTPHGAARADSPVWPLAFAGIALILLAARGAYAPRRRLRSLDDLRGIVSATAVTAMTVISARVLLGHDGDVGTETAYFWLLATSLIGLGRVAVLRSEARARRSGEAVDATLIVGAGRVGHVTARRLLAEPELGLRPIGFLDADPLEVEPREAAGLPVLGGISELDRVVAEQGVQHVVVTFSRSSHDALLQAIRRCRELGVSVSILPRLFEVEGERVSVERLGSLPLVGIEATDPKGWRFKVKYAAEPVIAALALVLTLPLFAIAVVAIKATMGGPVLFRQRRVGADGREFDMLKLRTMKGRPEEDEEADIDWAIEQLASHGAEPDEAEPALRQAHAAVADRRTRVGRMLRRFSLDEVPQLWNVVRREMSLVGPRPERVSYVRSFERSIYRYADRHRVKSGITGWAQVNGLRGKTSLRDRVEWDNYYIENWSAWLDLKILVLTTACILRGQHEDDPWK
jgi:exopolysaccharide biosynthesis polyprenyl glycosylphosphotransferase